MLSSPITTIRSIQTKNRQRNRGTSFHGFSRLLTNCMPSSVMNGNELVNELQIQIRLLFLSSQKLLKLFRKQHTGNNLFSFTKTPVIVHVSAKPSSFLIQLLNFSVSTDNMLNTNSIMRVSLCPWVHGSWSGDRILRSSYPIKPLRNLYMSKSNTVHRHPSSGEQEITRQAVRELQLSLFIELNSQKNCYPDK